MEYFINADAVVIQRDFPRHESLYHSIIDWAEKNHKPVLYEIDDVLFDLPDDHPEKVYFQPFEETISNAIKQSHAVITTTNPLAQRLSVLNPNTWVLPNYLDDQIWGLFGKTDRINEDHTTAIGYMGGITQTHLPDIAMLNQVLKEILREFAGKVELHFWGVVPDELKGMSGVVFHIQSFPDYRDFAKYFSEQAIDIFLAPLIINAFNECKSAIKFLEYSSLSSPGIYSEISPYMDIVKHGQNSFLSSSIGDWDSNLRLLIQDQQLRKNLGQNALNTVRQLYLLSQHASEWERVYEAAITS